MKLNQVSGIKNRCLIVGFGDDLPEHHPEITAETLVISVDGGYKWTEAWGLKPDLVVGDLDSIDPEQRQSLVFKEIPVLQFPVEKDETDLELAVNYAKSLGIKDFIITGAWGGSIAHSLGNLEILYKLGQEKLTAQLLTRRSRLYLVNEHLSLDLPLGTTVSLVPLTPTVVGVSTAGLYYPLSNAEVVKGQTKTISNKSVMPQVTITAQHGILLAIVEQNE